MDEVSQPVGGDGFAVGQIDAIGDRLDPATVRKVRNVGDSDVYLVAGGKDGYVGRDGRLPEGESSPRGEEFSGPPGAGPPLPGEDA